MKQKISLPLEPCHLLAMLAVALLLTCCRADEWEPRPEASAPGLRITAATFTANFPVRATTETTVRATDETTVTSGSMGIFRAKGAGYTSTLDNCQYAYNTADATWQPATTQDIVLLHGDDAAVCAYYPHHLDDAYNDKTRLPLTSGKYLGTPTTHDPADLCFDTDRPVNAFKRYTAFQFKRALALLQLSVSVTSDFKAPGNIYSIILDNPEQITASSLDISDGSCHTTPTKGRIAYVMTHQTVTANLPILISTLLVPFKPDDTGMAVVLDVDHQRIEFTIPSAQITEFVAGRRYVVRVTLNGTNALVTGVDRLPWDEEILDVVPEQSIN